MDRNFDNQAEVGAFLRRQQFEAVGFSAANPTRRKVAMTYGEYPLRGNDQAMMNVQGAGGSTVEGGDSGRPLFLLRRLSDGTVKRFVAGICQGIEWGGGRYTLTGINLKVQGTFLKFPYDPSTVDWTRAAPIGEWLNSVMSADFTSRHNTIPLYNWFGTSQADNFLTSDPRWASDPLGVVPDASGVYLDPQRRQNGDYQMYRLEGFAFNPKKPLG